MKIRIATWNIGGAKPIRDINNFGFSDDDYFDEDTAYFASEIRELDPDIVCLQETHVNPERSVAKEVGKAAGTYECIEVSLSESHIDARYLLGNAVLTKKEPHSEVFHALPYPDFPLSLPNGKPAKVHKKGVQVLSYDFGTVANTHLQPLRFLGMPYESEDGQRYAREVEKEFERYLSAPLLLCGDFNYAHAETLYGELVEKFALRNVLPSYPTCPDGKVKDYIFTSSNFTLIDAGIIKTRADHFLCWADVETS